MNILLISGSLRKESYNTKLLLALQSFVPDSADVVWGDINLPLFNADLEGSLSDSVTQLKSDIAAADAVLIATPEYNRTTSGALKNALDWGSRPRGENSWSGKRVYVLSASTGSIAGALAFYDVKKALLHMGAIVPAQPEFMVAHAPDKFGDDGSLTDEKTAGHLKRLIEQVCN